MGVPDSSLHDLENHRRELEDNVRKLEKSLYHWRTWEAEYDSLNEEILSLSENAATDDFLQIGREFGGTLVNEAELDAILGGRQGLTRSRQQIVDIISRRVDYVKQNVGTMEKRLRAAETQLDDLDTAEQPPSQAGAEYPMTDIMEELDDEGQVISSSVNTPGDNAPELLEVLKRAGVKDIPEAAKKSVETSPSQVTEVEEGPEEEEKKDNSRVEPSQPISQDIQSRNAVEQPSEDQEQPVTEIDEPPDDAKLRREMLEYGLNEVGSIVAELDLDENASDISMDDEEGSYDYESEEDEEDEYGRTTHRVLNDDYHQQMRELEAKLNARGMYNMGKDTAALPDELRPDIEQARPELKAGKPDDTVSKQVSEKKPKKKVAFAENIDIAPAPQEPSADKATTPQKEPEVAAVSDSIVERTETNESGSATPAPPKKVSRFKSARKAPETSTEDDASSQPAPSANSPRPPEVRSTRKSNAPNPSTIPLFPARPTEPKPFSQPITDTPDKKPSPQPPEDRILADKLVERHTPEQPANPPEPDELDESIHRKEIASEFYQMRNKMIREQGGFVDDEDDEPEMVPIETEEAPKRVSKFKAARMK